MRMKTFLAAMFGILAFVSFQHPVLAVEGEWEVMSEGDGLKTFRKEVPGSPVVAFKGEAIMNAEVPVIVQILSDPALQRQWIARLIETEKIREVSKAERIEYNHTGAPWPLKDRDFLYDVKAELDSEKKEVRLMLKSVEDPACPVKPDKVRGNLVFGLYVIKAIENGKKSLLSVEIHADPKGAVPKWVVNLFQKSWPRKSLENIRTIVAKNNTPPHPDVKPWFDGLFVPIAQPVK